MLCSPYVFDGDLCASEEISGYDLFIKIVAKPPYFSLLSVGSIRSFHFFSSVHILLFEKFLEKNTR